LTKRIVPLLVDILRKDDLAGSDLFSKARKKNEKQAENGDEFLLRHALFGEGVELPFSLSENTGFCPFVSREKRAQHVEDKRIAVGEGLRAGMVRCERKGEQARDLLRDGVLGEKGR